MTDRTQMDRPHSEQFEAFSLQCLQTGLRIRFQARGASMSPTIRDGEMVYVKPASEVILRRGDIVLVKDDRGFRLHRLVRIDPRLDVFVTRGDSGLQDDHPVCGEQILGIAVAKDIRIGRGIATARFRGPRGAFLRTLARAQAALTRLVVARMRPIVLRRAFRETLRSSGLIVFLWSVSVLR